MKFLMWVEDMKGNDRLKKVLERFKENTKYTEDILIEFLLGEQNEDMDSSVRSRIKNQSKAFTGKKRQKLIDSSDWCWERWKKLLDVNCSTKEAIGTYNDLVEKAKDYYKDYIQEEFEGDSCELFRRIALFIWLKVVDSEMVFKRESIEKSMPVLWNEKVDEIKTVVEKEKITFVRGSAAYGKQSLAKEFLRQQAKSEYIFAEVISGDGENEVKVKVDKKELELEDFLSCFKWWDDNDYVVLKWSYYAEEGLETLLKWSKNHKPKIIVVTRMNILNNQYGQVLVGFWDRKELMKIVEANMSESLRDNTEGFFWVLDYNPFLVDVFSRYLEAKQITMQSFYRAVFEEGATEISYLSKGTNVYSNYRNRKSRSSYSVSTIVLRSLAECTDRDISLLHELYIWTRIPIGRNFLIQVGGFEDDDINDLINKGYLILYTDGKVKMNAVFAWSIAGADMEFDFIKETYKLVVGKNRKIAINESSIQKGLRMLDLMTRKMEYHTSYIQYFYQVLNNIIYRYHHIFGVKLNLRSRELKQHYLEWTEFLERAMIIIREMGNVNFAKKINDTVYVLYKRSKREILMDSNQKYRKNMELLNLSIMNGNVPDEMINELFSMFSKYNDFEALHWYMDLYIYKEMMEIINNAEGIIDGTKFNCQNKDVLNAFLLYYRNRHEGLENTGGYYLCRMFGCYSKALYTGQSADISEAQNEFEEIIKSQGSDCDDKISIRARCYYMFFELMIDYKKRKTETKYLCEKYESHCLRIMDCINKKCYDIMTMHLVFISLFLTMFLVPSWQARGQMQEFYQSFVDENNILFVKIAETYKYQFNLNMEEYQKILDAIKKSMRELAKQMKESYTFKENE